ncbi:hypothetical protein TWF569_000853 [Orbilia oligospora]|uniref:Uncharacterized protein n=1 Tax=Orbilia oligospora TaxID=2813651 RepID=A0A7C8JTL7_ORBOL|nr:hypothetical protein TWF103_001090 [Orbilia oligospora]KAF3142037.1 hypothetical protein TWF703_001260 [Orbilia oligospora]KAF3146492.1 hypothetical protein TWF594_003282 [Orbilia oligospora]KAF3154014.1 hypothetical protein TWF569_000853 [Orbilia oligospora]
MHFPTLFTSVSFMLVSIADLASAHSTFIDAYGDANAKIHGHGLGFNPSTPRTIVPGNNYLYKQDAVGFGSRYYFPLGFRRTVVSGCGSTYETIRRGFSEAEKGFSKLKDFELSKFLRENDIPSGGYVDTTNEINKLALSERTGAKRNEPVINAKGISVGIPKVTAGGTLTIVNFQMDVDGAGPFDCKIDLTGTGNNWSSPLKVTKNCPGNNISLHAPGRETPCKFEVAMPKQFECKGSYGANGSMKNICLVRCENKAANGPFGGCVPIQQVQPAKARSRVMRRDYDIDE